MEENLIENVADLYIRVSTTEQTEEGYSVGEQETRLRAYCSAYGYQIHAVHIDPGYSGATLDRPAIKRVIHDVKSGDCKKVIVWKLDRLSRSQKDTLILLEDVFLQNGCNFISLMESFDTSTPFGRCIVGILAAFAQMEHENIRARLMMGKQAGIKEGRYFSGKRPTGYRFELQPNGKRLLVMDPYESQIVRDMYDLYLSGKSLGEIAVYLQSKYGWNAGKDRSTAADSVSRILRNPVYAGNVKMGDLICEGKHEGLVSEDNWNTVNEKLKLNVTNFRRMYTSGTGNGSGTGTDGLLTGLLFCGDCGARMAMRGWKWRKGMSSQEKKYVCYSVSKCTRKMIRSDHCTNRKDLFTVADLDDLILDRIRELSLEPATLDSLIDKSASDKSAGTEIYKERLAEIEKQMTRLMNLFQSGLVELSDISDRLSDLKSERASLQKTVEEMETAAKGSKLPCDVVIAKLNDLSRIVEENDRNGLYDLVHLLIEKIVVLNGDVTIHWAFC